LVSFRHAFRGQAEQEKRESIRVIVPVLGNDSDKRLLKIVERIARRQDADVTLIYVVEVMQSMPLDAELPAEVTRGEQVLHEAREEIVRRLESKTAKVNTGSGRHHDELLPPATSRQGDLRRNDGLRPPERAVRGHHHSPGNARMAAGVDGSGDGMNVVIMGCGRVGARVASLLDQNGHSVTVIDTRPQAFDRLARDFAGDTVIGTGIDEDVLRLAGIESADTFIAVAAHDNRNLMAAQVAQVIFKVPQVIVRIYDPVREDTYRRMGLTTICPTTTISAMILDHVIGAGLSTSRRGSEG
jgi:trk system potassium uptake protein TrkA